MYGHEVYDEKDPGTSVQAVARQGCPQVDIAERNVVPEKIYERTDEGAYCHGNCEGRIIDAGEESFYGISFSRFCHEESDANMIEKDGKPRAMHDIKTYEDGARGHSKCGKFQPVTTFGHASC